MVKIAKFFLFLVLTGILISSVGLSGSSYYVSQVLAESSNSTKSIYERNNEVNVAESEATRGEPNTRSKESISQSKSDAIKTNNPPRAHAGPDIVVNEKDNVVLNAEKSTDPDGDKLSYIWSQLSPKNPKLDLKNSDTDKVSFVTPEIGAGAVILTFLLTVNDNDGEKARDIVQVKVNNLREDKKSAKSKESSSDHVTKNEIEIKEQAARPKLGTLTQKQFDSKFKDKLVTSALDRNLGLTGQKLPPHKMTAQEVGGDFSGTFNYQEDVTRHICVTDNQGKIGCQDSKFVVSVSSPISGSFEHDFVYSGPAHASCSISETGTYDGVPIDFPPPFKVGGFVNPLVLGGSSSLLGGYMTITDSSLVGGCGIGFHTEGFPLSQTANGGFKSEGNVKGFDCNAGGEGTCISNYGWNLVLQPVTPPPPPNNPPTANDQTVSTPENTAKAITLTGSDPEGNLLKYTIETQPVHGILTGSAPSVTYTPFKDYSGPDSFTFKVNDGKVDSNIATLSIMVLGGDFAISCPTDTPKIPRETIKNIDCNLISMQGFNRQIDLSCLSALVSVTCTLNPAGISPPANGNVPFALSIATTKDTPIGTHKLNLVGISGTIQHSISVTIQCTACIEQDEKKADKVLELIKRIIVYEKQNGLSEAAKRMEHWLAGSGAALPLDEDWLSRSGDISRGIRSLQFLYESNPLAAGSGNSLYKKAFQLKNGDRDVPFHDDWKYAISYPNPLSDYGAAVGRAQIVSIGDFKLSRQGNDIMAKGTVSYSLADRFNFNPGDWFPVPVSPFIGFADDFNILEKCRGAKAFQQEGQWSQDVEFKGNIQLMQSHPNWKWTPTKWNVIRVDFPF